MCQSGFCRKENAVETGDAECGDRKGTQGVDDFAVGGCRFDEIDDLFQYQAAEGEQEEDQQYAQYSSRVLDLFLNVGRCLYHRCHGEEGGTQCTGQRSHYPEQGQ